MGSRLAKHPRSVTEVGKSATECRNNYPKSLLRIWGRCPRDRGGQTCTYQDGSQKVFGNDEVGLKGLAASFSLAGKCGGLVVLFSMLIAAIVGGRLVKPKATS